MWLRYYEEGRRKILIHAKKSGLNYIDNRALLRVTFSHISRGWLNNIVIIYICLVC